MKYKLFSLTLVLAAMLTLCIPAAAFGGMAPPDRYGFAEADSFPAAGETIGFVTDAAGVMTSAERTSLEDYAQSLCEQYDFGAYLVTVPDFRAATGEYDVYDAATAIYQAYDMGVGEEDRGVLLLVSTQTRDYSLITYSDYGNFLFDGETRSDVIDGMIWELSDDRWYDAFANYLAGVEYTLDEGGGRLGSAITSKIALIFVIPLLIAAVVVWIVGQKMKTVARAREALAYTPDGLQLTEHTDLFINTTVIRRKKSNSSSGGGGGRSHRSGGGFSGTSGKF